ncbi:hypothetical protein AYI70_g1136 [Smittium culicis]|uniref:Uncharacterized protein n=1 Tax=Smittium culicis TaxID=133412 RepID=A0A1R1YDU8_9FUNG|nr:hypothetical protein AYI70_g1136 [Smittium culicis]
MFTNSNPRLDSFKGCSEAAFDIILTYLHEDSLSDSQLVDIYTNFMVLISSFNTNNNLAIETTSTMIECIPNKSLLQIRDSIKLMLPSLSNHDSINLISLIKNLFLSFKKFQFISFFDLILKFNSFGNLNTSNLITSIKNNGSFSLSKFDILSDFSDNDLILSKISILEILILYLSANFKASKIELISIQAYLAAFLGFNHIYITYSDDLFIPKFSGINSIDSLPDILISENIPNLKTTDLDHLAHKRSLLFNKSFSLLELLLDTCWSDYQEKSFFYDLVYKDNSQTNEKPSTNSSYLSNLLNFTTKNQPFISDDIESQTSQFSSYPIPQNIPHTNIKNVNNSHKFDIYFTNNKNITQQLSSRSSSLDTSSSESASTDYSYSDLNSKFSFKNNEFISEIKIHPISSNFLNFKSVDDIGSRSICIAQLVLSYFEELNPNSDFSKYHLHEWLSALFVLLYKFDTDDPQIFDNVLSSLNKTFILLFKDVILPVKNVVVEICRCIATKNCREKTFYSIHFSLTYYSLCYLSILDMNKSKHFDAKSLPFHISTFDYDSIFHSVKNIIKIIFYNSLLNSDIVNLFHGFFFVQFDQLAIDSSLQRLSGAIGTQIFYIFSSLINSYLVGEGRKKLVQVLQSIDKLFEDNDEDIKFHILHIPVINSIDLLGVILEKDDSPIKATMILSLVNSYIKCHEKNNDSNISLFNHKFSTHFVKRSLKNQLSEIVNKNAKKFTKNEERSKFGREIIEFIILLARNSNSMTLKFSDECRLLQKNILLAILSNFDITEKSLFSAVESYYYIAADIKFRPSNFFLTSHGDIELTRGYKTCYRNILMELARDSKKFNEWNNDIFDFEVGSLGLKFIMNYIQSFKPDGPICFSSKSAFNTLKFIQKKCQSISKEVEDSVLQYKKIIKSSNNKSGTKVIVDNAGNKGVDFDKKKKNIASNNVYSEPRKFSFFNDEATSSNLSLNTQTFTPYNGKDNSSDFENRIHTTKPKTSISTNSFNRLVYQVKKKFRDYDDRDYMLLFEIAEKDFSEDSLQSSDNDHQNSSINNEFKSRLANILLPKKDNYLLPPFIRPTHNIRGVDILEFEKYYWALNSYIQKTSNFNGAHFFDSNVSAVDLIHSEVLDKYNSTYYFPPGSDGLSQYINFNNERLNIRELHNNFSPFRKDLLKQFNYIYNLEFLNKLMDTMENNISKNYLWANSRASSWVFLVSILGRISKAILNAKLLSGLNQSEINSSPPNLDLSKSSIVNHLDSFSGYQLKNNPNNYCSNADLEIPIEKAKFDIDSTLPNSINTKDNDIQSKKSSLMPTDSINGNVENNFMGNRCYSVVIQHENKDTLEEQTFNINKFKSNSMSLKNSRSSLVPSNDDDQLISSTNDELEPIQNDIYCNRNDRGHGTSIMNNCAKNSKELNHPCEVDINIPDDSSSFDMSKHNIQMPNIDITPAANSSKPCSLSDIDGSTPHINSENCDESITDNLVNFEIMNIKKEYSMISNVLAPRSYPTFKASLLYKVMMQNYTLLFPDDMEDSESYKSEGIDMENEGRNKDKDTLNQEEYPEEEFSDNSIYFGLDSLELDVDRILAMMHGPEMVIIEALNMMLDDDDL